MFTVMYVYCSLHSFSFLPSYIKHYSQVMLRILKKMRFWLKQNFMRTTVMNFPQSLDFHSVARIESSESWNSNTVGLCRMRGLWCRINEVYKVPHDR